MRRSWFACLEADIMIETDPSTTVILTACPDRRSYRRLEHAETVELDGRAVTGRDISACGLSVVIPPPVKAGDLVRVRLAGCLEGGEAVMASARVARLDVSPQGFVVGLEFIE